MPDGLQVTNQNGCYSDDSPADWKDLDLLAATLNAALWSGSNSQVHSKQSIANIATVAIAEHQKTLVVAFNDHKFNPSEMPKGGNVQKKPPSERVTNLQDVAVKADRIGFHEYKKTVSEPPLETDTIFDIAPEGAGQQGLFVIKQVYQQVPVKLKQGSQYIVRDYTFKVKNKGHEYFSPKNAFEEMIKTVLDEDGIVTEGMSVVALGPLNIAKEHAEMRLVNYFHSKFGKKPSYLGVSKPCCHKCAGQLDKDGISYARWATVVNIGDNWTAPDDISTTKVKYSFDL